MKRAILSLALTSLILLCACQPTPEESALPSNAEKAVEASLVSQAPEDDAAQTAAYPERWQDVFDADVPNVTVEVDAVITAQAMPVYGVYSVIPRGIEAVDLERILPAIAPGARIYPYQLDAQGNMLPIKSVVEEHIEELLDWINNAELYHPEHTPQQRAGYLAMQELELEELQAQYAIAVEMRDEDIITDYTKLFTRNDESVSAILLSKDGKDMGSFRVGTGNDYRFSGVSVNVPYEFIAEPSESFPDKTGSAETAQRFGERLVKQIGAEDFTLRLLQQEEDSGRITMYFARSYDGIPYCTALEKTPIQQMEMSELKELYEAYWPDEYIRIDPGDYGVCLFDWVSPTGTKERLRDVTLLPLSRILELFRKYIGYLTAYFEDDRIAARRIVITDIRLEYKRVPVRDAVGRYEATPVWTFIGHTVERFSDEAAAKMHYNGLNANNELQTETGPLLIINAVTGLLEG